MSLPALKNSWLSYFRDITFIFFSLIGEQESSKLDIIHRMRQNSLQAITQAHLHETQIEQRDTW